MRKSKYSYVVDYVDDITKDESRCEKIKKTKQRKRVEEHIAVAIMQDNPKRAIDLCEKYHIPPQDFAKMVVKYSPFIGATIKD